MYYHLLLWFLYTFIKLKSSYVHLHVVFNVSVLH